MLFSGVAKLMLWKTVARPFWNVVLMICKMRGFNGLQMASQESGSSGWPFVCILWEVK
jgi:hypothetical protein